MIVVEIIWRIEDLILELGVALVVLSVVVSVVVEGVSGHDWLGSGLLSGGWERLRVLSEVVALG